MTAFTKMVLRSAIIAGFIGYLIGDLLVLRGPLRRTWDRFYPGNVVARVSGREITRSQLERAAREQLWLEGKDIDSLTAEQRRIARDTALDELIDHELLRTKTQEQSLRLQVTDEEINERLRRLAGRFVSKGEMEQAMKSQGIASERELHDRIAARIQQEKYINFEISPRIQVTDEEARAWFATHEAQLAMPERINVRHVFIATLERPQDEAKALLETALLDLTSGRKDFATLARELSDDYANKENGGHLGWMTRERLPVDFLEAVFALALNRPTLVRTRIGWHLVEVMGRKPRELRRFEEAKPEIMAALEAVKRCEAIAELRAGLRESAEIEVFRERIEH